MSSTADWLDVNILHREPEFEKKNLLVITKKNFKPRFQNIHFGSNVRILFPTILRMADKWLLISGVNNAPGNAE